MTSYLDPIFSDPEVAPLVSTSSLLAAMVKVESALADVQGSLGVIPKDYADAISTRLERFEADEGVVANGVAQSGVPVIALIEQLRDAVGGDAAASIHWGATTQDIMDTALVLQLRQVMDILDARLSQLVALLTDHAEKHALTVMPGRTRFQQALPISFGLKVTNWMLPLHRHRQRLHEMRDRILMVQFGGAVGTHAALGESGTAVMERLGAALDLKVPATPWHVQRDGIVEMGAWLASVSGALGKIGQDIALMAQSEVAEAREGAVDGVVRGGSSTMPQKANPVAAEALIALGRESAGLIGTLYQAQIQEHERGSPGWTLEWQALPRLCVAAAASTRHALELVQRLKPQADRMRANLGNDGLILAEAASFALADHMPRPDAQALVKRVARQVAMDGGNLFERLKLETDAPVDWDAVSDPANYLGETQRLIERALSQVRATE